MSRPGQWSPLLSNLSRFLAHPLPRYALSWLLAVTILGWVAAVGWNYFNRTNRDEDGNLLRRDGNNGHTSIDFGGQWTMGRMLVLGQADYLYERRHQRQMLKDSFSIADQEPATEETRSDAEWMMYWFMGSDNSTLESCLSPLAGQNVLEVAVLAGAGLEKAWQPKQMENAARIVGGPLYPPINAFWMYPLALSSPQDGYRIHQLVDVGLAVLAAWGVSVLSRGRLWMPVVLALLPLYPGFHGSHLLGQNSVLTLLLLIWGWVLISRGRDGCGGLVWGLLAFKPVWALSFFLVLLVSRRWRAAAVMAATGVAQIALTLPVVGLHAWREWLKIGKDAADLYQIDGNWVFLSRDLLGIPRRWMLDWELPSNERDLPEAAVVGWAVLLGAFVLLVVLAVWKRREIQASEGPPAAFLLLGGWLCCYHFMYYDVLLSFLPVMLLFTESGWRVRPEALARMPLLWQAWLLRPWSVWPGRPGADTFRITTGEVAMLWLPSPRGYGWIANSVPLLGLLLMLGIEGPFRDWFGFSDKGTPWNTFCLMLLWLWCGWRLIRTTAAVGPTRHAEVVSTDAERAELMVHGNGVAAAQHPADVDVTPAPAP